MSTPEQIAEQARQVGRVRAARMRRDEAAARATAELHAAIRDAYDSGAAVLAIAKAAGLSRQRIHQILRGQ